MEGRPVPTIPGQWGGGQEHSGSTGGRWMALCIFTGRLCGRSTRWVASGAGHLGEVGDTGVRELGSGTSLRALSLRESTHLNERVAACSVHCVYAREPASLAPRLRRLSDRRLGTQPAELGPLVSGASSPLGRSSAPVESWSRVQGCPSPAALARCLGGPVGGPRCSPHPALSPPQSSRHLGRADRPPAGPPSGAPSTA